MSFTIAVAGKGGTGKTTIAGLVIRYLLERGEKPVLALDGDANANLQDILGVRVQETVGAAREDVMDSISTLPAGMTKESYMELKLQQTLVEAEGFDLLVMGRPEGPGCYCYANSIFRKYVDMILSNYRFIVMDNEAGMEHLSRHTTQDVDLLLIISDPTVRGIQSAARINSLVDELELRVARRFLVIDRAPAKIPPSLMEEVERCGLELVGTIPEDKWVSEYDMVGEPLIGLPSTSPAVEAVNRIMEKIKIVDSRAKRGA